MDLRGWATKGHDSQLKAFHPALAVSFLLGILAIYNAPTLPGPHWYLLSCTLALLLWWRHHFFGHCLLALCAGALWISLISYQHLNSLWPESSHGEDIWLSGRIVDIPAHKGSQAKFLFQSDEFDGLIKVTWYRTNETLLAGQCRRLKLRMRSPRGSLNPGGFDYEAWLFRQNIAATAYVRKALPCADEIAQKNFKLQEWRQSAILVLKDALQGHAMTSVVVALALGQRSDFSDKDWRMLRQTGASHLMAISGLHIGIVMAWLYWLSAGLWRRSSVLTGFLSAPKAGLLIGTLVGAGYALMSGFGLPAQRALIMMIIFSIAGCSGRRIAPTQVLAIALVVVLVADPFSVADAGFWLSFGAVGWIAYLFTARWQRMAGLPALLYLQFCLGIALMPLTLFWFAEVSWISPIVNLILVPFFGLLVPILLVAVLLALLMPEFAQLPLLWAADVLGWVWFVLHWLVANFNASFLSTLSGPFVVILACSGVAWLCAPGGWPARSLGLFCLLPVLLTSPGSSSGLAKGSYRITALDVGQGLSVVVETADKVLVYDAGPAYAGGFDAGAMVVVPYLRSRGIHQIDMLVQSHGDLDHAGGVGAIQQAMSVVETVGLDPSKPCRRGYGWAWGDIHFEFLHPGLESWKGNNSSCVLKLSAGPYATLLTGDIEAQVERLLVREYGERLDSAVLIAPHHGSATSSTQVFLESVNPQITIFSAGWHNRWGFPKPEVLARYEKIGSELYTTAESGAIQLVVSANEGISATTIWRQQRKRLWRQ